MPIYEYQCDHCGERFEYLVRGDDQAVCPACGGHALTKQISAPAGHVTTSGNACCPARATGACDGPKCPGCNCF